jgi:hypothetical protein
MGGVVGEVTRDVGRFAGGGGSGGGGKGARLRDLLHSVARKVG